jgi:hypothetical protein
MSKDYQFRVQTSETLIIIAACAQTLRRFAHHNEHDIDFDGGAWV